MLSISKIPRAGLANKILVWANGCVFAHIDACEHLYTGMVSIHIGPILRGEQSYRFYATSFKSRSVVHWVKIKTAFLFKKPHELTYESCTQVAKEDAVYVFSKVPNDTDFFYGINKHRDYVVAEFFKILSNTVIQKVNAHGKPEIAVHIRRGDFVLGGINTDLLYFTEAIQTLRLAIGSDMGVTIFSDGTPDELASVLNLPNVQMAKDDLDIVQLLVLANSKVIVMSAGSTFGMWAGFISNALLLKHPTNEKLLIRGNEMPETIITQLQPAHIQYIQAI